MKKVLAVLIAISICFGLVGCGKTTTKSTPTSKVTTTATPTSKVTTTEKVKTLFDTFEVYEKNQLSAKLSDVEKATTATGFSKEADLIQMYFKAKEDTQITKISFTVKAPIGKYVACVNNGYYVSESNFKCIAGDRDKENINIEEENKAFTVTFTLSKTYYMFKDEVIGIFLDSNNRQVYNYTISSLSIM